MTMNPDQNDPNAAAASGQWAAADPKGAGGASGAEPKSSGAGKTSAPAKKAAGGTKETKPSPSKPSRTRASSPTAVYTAARAQTPDGYSTGLHPLNPADESGTAYDTGYTSGGRVWPD